MLNYLQENKERRTEEQRLEGNQLNKENSFVGRNQGRIGSAAELNSNDDFMGVILSESERERKRRMSRVRSQSVSDFNRANNESYKGPNFDSPTATTCAVTCDNTTCGPIGSISLSNTATDSKNSKSSYKIDNSPKMSSDISPDGEMSDDRWSKAGLQEETADGRWSKARLARRRRRMSDTFDDGFANRERVVTAIEPVTCNSENGGMQSETGMESRKDKKSWKEEELWKGGESRKGEQSRMGVGSTNSYTIVKRSSTATKNDDKDLTGHHVIASNGGSSAMAPGLNGISQNNENREVDSVTSNMEPVNIVTSSDVAKQRYKDNLVATSLTSDSTKQQYLDSLTLVELKPVWIGNDRSPRDDTSGFEYKTRCDTLATGDGKTVIDNTQMRSVESCSADDTRISDFQCDDISNGNSGDGGGGKMDGSSVGWKECAGHNKNAVVNRKKIIKDGSFQEAEKSDTGVICRQQKILYKSPTDGLPVERVDNKEVTTNNRSQRMPTKKAANEGKSELQAGGLRKILAEEPRRYSSSDTSRVTLIEERRRRSVNDPKVPSAKLTSQVVHKSPAVQSAGLNSSRSTPAQLANLGDPRPKSSQRTVATNLRTSSAQHIGQGGQRLTGSAGQSAKGETETKLKSTTVSRFSRARSFEDDGSKVDKNDNFRTSLIVKLRNITPLTIQTSKRKLLKSSSVTSSSGSLTSPRSLTSPESPMSPRSPKKSLVNVANSPSRNPSTSPSSKGSEQTKPRPDSNPSKSQAGNVFSRLSIPKHVTTPEKIRRSSLESSETNTIRYYLRRPAVQDTTGALIKPASRMEARSKPAEARKTLAGNDGHSRVGDGKKHTTMSGRSDSRVKRGEQVGLKSGSGERAAICCNVDEIDTRTELEEIQRSLDNMLTGELTKNDSNDSSHESIPRTNIKSDKIKTTNRRKLSDS